MGRSYKKVPAVKKKEIIEICKNKYLQETTDTLLYYLENTKNRIKKENEEQERSLFLRLVSANKDS